MLTNPRTREVSGKPFEMCPCMARIYMSYAKAICAPVTGIE